MIALIGLAVFLALAGVSAAKCEGNWGDGAGWFALSGSTGVLALLGWLVLGW